jgi:hypothetical protein
MRRISYALTVSVALFIAASQSIPIQAQTFQNIPALSFTMRAGGANPLPQVLSVLSTTTNFDFDVTPSTSSGGNWLSYTAGPNCCATPWAITVTVTNVSALAPGAYAGQLLFKQFPSATAIMTVPVTLFVERASAQSLAALPGELSFSMKTSGNTPPGQFFQVRNAGTGTLNWTLTASTADGGDWLQPSVLGGTAPSPVTVAIQPSDLPGGGDIPGTFEGQLLFQAGGDSLTVPVSVYVGDSVFVQVNPLTFTMVAGGANPLPQLLPVANTGTKNFDFTPVVSTSSGGNWLSYTAGPNCCNTPWAFTVNVANVSALAPGTYMGEITFSQFPSAISAITVPVTLIIEPASSSFLAALPGALSFSMKTSGNPPPGQVFQVRNSGSGTLHWTLTATTADGGSWLLPSVSSGTAPSKLTVAIEPSILPGGGTVAGMFGGQLLFRSGTDSVTVPVSVNIGTSVFLQVDPISFTMLAGGANPLSQVLAVASTGPTNFDFTPIVSTSSGGNWLSLSEGPNCCATPWAVTVNVANVSSLAAGTYMGEITFNQFPSALSAITVPVTLVIEPPSSQFLANLPGQLSFSMKTAGLSPPAQTIQVRDGGTGVLNWTLAATTSDGGSWLKATALSGTSPKSVSISVAAAMLPGGGATPGTFGGQLLFQSGLDSVTVPVSVTVGASVFVQANPINFIMPAGGANPLPQVLSVASTGTNFDFSPTVSTSSGGNWLSFTVGPNCCATSWAVTLIVENTSGLAAGTYAGQVMLNQFPDATFAMTVPVTLTVVALGEAFFDNLPGQTSFSFVPGGNPTNQIVPIYDGGSGTLNWNSTKTTSDGGAWLSVSPASGAAPSTVTVHVNSSKLPGGGSTAGTYVGQQVLSSPTGNVTVPVSVIVGSSVFVPVNALTFVATVGSSPPDQTIPVASTGSNFDFVWLASTGAGGNWLSLSGGVNCCSTPWTVTVSVNSSALAAGNYVGQIILTPWPDATSAMTVPVILTVTQ